MKNVSRFLSLLIIFVSSHNYAGEQGRKIVRIDLTYQNKQTVDELFKLGIDVIHVNPEEHYVNALVTSSELSEIEGLYLPVHVQIEDADSIARIIRQSGYLNRFRNYDQIVVEMTEIAAMYPSIVKLIDIGDSYEKTIGKGGYDIWAMKISDYADIEEDEPEIFFFANIHAREIITPEVIMYFMRYLVEYYGSDPDVTYLVNNRQIWLSPMVNPDGHEYVMSGSNPKSGTDPMWWRKNKRDNNGNSIFDSNYDGVDLNRNFGYKWAYDNIGSSPYPSSETYRGSAPFSEPESKAIRDFVVMHRFAITLSFHSYGQWWIYPWGYTTTSPDTPDHQQFVALADCCVAYNGYNPVNGDDFLYTTNGDTDDWLYGEQETKNKIFAFTPEVGHVSESLYGNTGFFPDTMYIEKQILENQGPLFYLAYAAGEEPIITHYPPDGTMDVAGPHQLSCTIQPPIVLTESAPLDTAELFVYYNTSGVSPFDSSLLAATAIPDQYMASIPASEENDTIYYYFAASDMFGRTGHAPRTAPLELFSFRISPDTTAPSIEHTPISNQFITTTSFPVKAKIIDDSDIAGVMLYYRQNHSLMDSVQMESTGQPDEYLALIEPDSIQVGDQFEYRIVAFDNSARTNSATVPAEDFYRFTILGGYAFDFELTNGGFISNEQSDWQWGRPRSGPYTAHSGTNVWATNINGNYSNGSNSWLDMTPIILMNISEARLSFWHWYQFEYSQNSFRDGGNVKISVNDAPFKILTPAAGYDGVIDSYNTIMGNEPAFGREINNGNYWHEENFDLSTYIDSTIVIRFHFSSDGNTTESGWYIDDVYILTTPTNIDRSLSYENCPNQFELKQNYPNPFNPETVISYFIAYDAHVTLVVFNTLGQEIQSLVNAHRRVGFYHIAWNGTDHHGKYVPSGVYIYRLITMDFVQMKKMILLR